MNEHLREFKELLVENEYEVKVDPKKHYKDRSINIKYAAKPKKKLTLGRRMTLKLGISKDKRKLTPQEKVRR